MISLPGIGHVIKIFIKIYKYTNRGINHLSNKQAITNTYNSEKWQSNLRKV